MGMRVSGVLVFSILVAFLATSSMALESDFYPANDGRMTPMACCDQCFCTRSIPPQCQCSDVKNYCHAACRNCLCTKSIPPQCQCHDILEYCHAPCPMDYPQI